MSQPKSTPNRSNIRSLTTLAGWTKPCAGAGRRITPGNPVLRLRLGCGQARLIWQRRQTGLSRCSRPFACRG
jgi:hypothetical protein